ncbi:murein biosynthesis integral membrane protein MurJ [Exiguobacterium acetylicum]|uniref:murein biosynthesis integral membrane protein MurJ n=1 Tax=Exiguobacterium acetylicum TaxID=41170 RepID=UPI003877789E
MGKVAIIIFICSILSKIIGFYREILIGQLYGVSAITDSFFISLTIPWTLFGVISTGLLSSYLPIYSSAYLKNKREAEFFTSTVINIVTFIIVPFFYISIYIYSNELVGLFSENLINADVERTVIFLKITTFVLFFTGVLAVWTGKLQFHNLFTIIPLSGIILNVVIIFCVYLSKYYSIYFLPLSIVIGNLIQFIIVLIYMKYKNILNYHFSFKLQEKNLSEFSKLILPIMLSASSSQVIYFIDQVIASKAAIGGVSLINYTQKINEVFMQLFVVTIITIVFPKLSKISNDNLLFNLTLKRSVDIISFLCIPLVFFIISNSNLLIRIIYGGNSFNRDDISQMTMLLIFYSASILIIGYRELLIKALFAKKISKVIMYFSIVTLFVNTTLSIEISKRIGIIGIPISGFISNFITVIFISFYLNKKTNFKLINKKSFLIFINILAYSLLSTIGMNMSEKLLSNNINIILNIVFNFIIFITLFLIFIYISGYLKYIKKIIK